MSTSQLDANQVIRLAADETNEALRVNVVASTPVSVDASSLATNTNQTNGLQKTQIVDGSNNVISSTNNALDVNIKSESLQIDVGISEADDSVQIYGNDGSANKAIKTDATGHLDIVGTVTTTTGDTTVTGTLTNLNDAVTISAAGKANIDFQISYTSWTGQITFEGTVDGTNWQSVFAYLAGTGQTKTFYQNPASGTIYRTTIAGFHSIRVRLSNANSGTATIYARASDRASGVFVNFPLPTGSNIIGSVGIDQTTNGTTNAVYVNNLPATQPVSGTVSANVKDGSGNAITSGLVGSNRGLHVETLGFTLSEFARNDYTSVNVTTSAYTQLIASTSNEYHEIEIFDSSGQTLKLAIGGSGSEVDKFLIFPGGNGRLRYHVASGSRISIKAVSSTANAGEISLNLYG